MNGSSPRVRGTGGSRRDKCGYHAVHPRVCGEQFADHESASRFAGSSPRVRGTRKRDRNYRCSETVHPRVCGEQYCWSTYRRSELRFIPACAGNSTESGASDCASSVHPRVCGEQPLFRPFHDEPSGSSPRVRGTVIFGIFLRYVDRFIPACAGTAPSRSRRVFLRRFIPACAGNSSETGL